MIAPSALFFGLSLLCWSLPGRSQRGVLVLFALRLRRCALLAAGLFGIVYEHYPKDVSITPYSPEILEFYIFRSSPNRETWAAKPVRSLSFSLSLLRAADVQLTGFVWSSIS